MRIAFAAAEAAPFLKVGGLADVAGSLPQALAAAGHEVTLYLPLHRGIDRDRYAIPRHAAVRPVTYGASHAEVAFPEIVRDGVRTVFVEDDERIARDTAYGQPDDDRRYAFWCRAVAEHVAAGPAPDVVHGHDWHAGLLMELACRDLPTVFTIHNLAYQGRTSVDVLDLIGLRRTRLLAEQRGELNPLARGISSADVVTTVSERYAEEILTPELGAGLHDLLRERRADLVGIVNGIDTRLFDPAADPHIAAAYSADDLAGKARGREALEREAGFAPDPRAPLLGVVGRLVEQKGVDILTAAAGRLVDEGARLVVLGTGEPAYEDAWRRLAAERPRAVRAFVGFDAALAQRIYAGADMFLMPSRFEPCGLGQLIALRYGTVPVVHAVGGLRDTVRDADASRDGNGFVFETYAADALVDAVRRATAAFRDGARWLELRRRGMREDHSWDRSAAGYVAAYRRAGERHRADLARAGDL